MKCSANDEFVQRKVIFTSGPENLKAFIKEKDIESMKQLSTESIERLQFLEKTVCKNILTKTAYWSTAGGHIPSNFPNL